MKRKEISVEPKPRPVEIDKSRLGQPSEEPVPAPAESAAASPGVPLTPEQIEAIQEKVVAVLRTCFDPEIPVNVYELGLIYNIDVSPTGAAQIKMTLTSPACPVAGSLPPEIQAKIQAIPGVTSAKVDIVWDPPWDKDMMSEAARLELGIFD
ncbi:MAG: DUF59 domain-containing protein [Planctomycetes bacterium]|nr:DUF59 domain-containing protein [Planctomycetota bacterium]